MKAKTAKAWGHIYRDGRLCRTAQAQRDVVWDVPVRIVPEAEYLRLKRAASKRTCAGCAGSMAKDMMTCVLCSRRPRRDNYKHADAKKGGGR